MELSKRRNAPHITHTENNKAALLSVSFFFSLAATNRVFIIKLHDDDEKKELGLDKISWNFLKE